MYDSYLKRKCILDDLSWRHRSMQQPNTQERHGTKCDCLHPKHHNVVMDIHIAEPSVIQNIFSRNLPTVMGTQTQIQLILSALEGDPSVFIGNRSLRRISQTGEVSNPPTINRHLLQ